MWWVSLKFATISLQLSAPTTTWRRATTEPTSTSTRKAVAAGESRDRRAPGTLSLFVGVKTGVIAIVGGTQFSFSLHAAADLIRYWNCIAPSNSLASAAVFRLWKFNSWVLWNWRWGLWEGWRTVLCHFLSFSSKLSRGGLVLARPWAVSLNSSFLNFAIPLPMRFGRLLGLALPHLLLQLRYLYSYVNVISQSTSTSRAEFFKYERLWRLFWNISLISLRLCLKTDRIQWIFCWSSFFYLAFKPGFLWYQ